MRLGEGSKALKPELVVGGSADTDAAKGKRAKGLERGTALQREQGSEGENPKNAWA
jgi:hypothetical protein